MKRKKNKLMNMQSLLLKYSLLLLVVLSSCSKSKSYTVEVKADIDNYLLKSKELHNIPGLALAVIKDNELVYKSYFGKASLEENTLVKQETLFRIFSATKLITTTGIFQLIEDEKLSLEDPISKYLNYLPTHWKNIKVKNLVSHSSGLPDIIRYESTLSDDELFEKLYKDKMEFTTGYQFSYNQTNYLLLASIIEEITGTTFEEYILNNQFSEVTTGVLFSSNSQENIDDRANRYYFDTRNNKFEKFTRNDGERGHSGNGLNITLDTFIEWDENLKNGTLLNKKTKSKMWSTFNYTYEKDNFLHGWGSYYVNNLESYGLTGGNLAAYRFFPKKNLTIILLSNGYEIEGHDIIVNDVARMAIPELRKKDLTLEGDVMKFVLNEELDEALEAFNKLYEENPNSLFDNLKRNINGIGNSLTWNDKPNKAFEVFKLNAKANPNWWISIAALAETYEAQNDTLNAIKNYKKAISLNEKNEYNYNPYMENKINELTN